MNNPMSIRGEKWIVSLSNGMSISEDQLADEPQRISPWSKLVDEVLPAMGTHITQLRVHVQGRTYSCISSSDRCQFPNRVKPISYLCMRRTGVDALNVGNRAARSDYIGMWAELPDGTKITTWIDIHTGDSWQQIQ